MASISYTPAPHEQAYFEALFRTADVQGTGNIGGAQAVQFFARSKLPVEVLKNIWTVADRPSTSSLDHAKFAVALRLIQLTQNGQKGQGANLSVAPGVQLRPVFFEGVSGVSVPMPPSSGESQQQQPTVQQQQRGMPPSSPGRAFSPQHQMQQHLPPQSPQRYPIAPPPQHQMQQQQPQQTPDTSRALVGQDPYAMTPQERARYESLFPQYAKPDGFVYGQEAVALFSKSGVDQSTLRDIWNMVDRGPVDNRLDKLEFAMAMHLIVCISKKSLPPPQGGTLPNSLRALKAASSGTGEVPSPQQPGSPSHGSTQGPGGNMAAPLSPMPAPHQIPSPQQSMQQQDLSHQYHHQQKPQPRVETVEETPAVGPPPVVGTQGGMSISDAFEGLSLTSDQPQRHVSSTSAPPVESRSLPSYVPEVSAQEPSSMSPRPSYVHSAPEETPAAVPSSSAQQAPQANAALNVASYDLGDSHAELDKLKSVLQKLQAENISLKAQMGSMSDGEKEVQKELGATVAEIGRLSAELSAQRHQVLEAKNRLLEASAELKAQQEHKSVLKDLISEAKETKATIEDVTLSIENANQAHSALETQKNEAMKKTDLFETSLFGYEDSRAGLAVEDNNSGASEGFNNEPSARPPPSQYGAETTSRSGQDPSPHAFNSYGSQPSSQHSESLVVPQAHLQHHQQSTPTNLNRPPAVSGHNRQSSGFDSGFVMGGSAPPLQEQKVPEQGSLSSAARAHSSSGDYGFEDEEAFKIVEEMKKKAERAAEAARDAEAASSRLASEADELRTDADKAEANARTLRAAADEKKKGRFGGGKKKNMLRDAERAAQDAAELKKRFMAVQTQAHDTATLAAETRREANRLKDEAEKAELEMASAASLKEQQKVSAPMPQQNGTNGHGMALANYGGTTSAAEQGYGGYSYGQYGQPMMAPANDGGFAPGVMGGGNGPSYDLPSPAAYNNPF